MNSLHSNKHCKQSINVHSTSFAKTFKNDGYTINVRVCNNIIH